MLNNNKKQETQFFGTKCGNANSIAAGYATETTNYGEIATGILNKSTKGDNPNSPEGVVGDPKATLFSVGCGTKEERKNALEVKGDGSVIISGKDGSDVNIADLAEKMKEPSVDLSGYVKSDEIYQCIKKEYDLSKRGKGAIAIDDSAKAKGRNSIAIGASALTGSYDDSSIAIGASALTDYDYAIALGYNAHATRRYTIALGYGAQAISENVIALGNNAQATSTNDIVLGYDAKSTGGNSIALGRNAQTESRFSIVLGCDAKIIGDGYYNIALGCNSQSKNYSSIAIGYYCIATGNNSIALGESAQATGINSTALGYRAQATGKNSTALGYAAKATKDYSIALGTNTNIKSFSKYALGGFDENKKVIYNLEEITYSQYGNKKYLIGLGGYDGTNITINNEAGEEVLNPNIKSVQEIINGKVDLTPIVTSTDATISLQPNKKYEITAGNTLVLTFTEPSDNTHKNEYLFSINTGSSVSTITFPIEIIWDVEPVISANKHYEINVQYSQGKYWGTVHTWNIPS